MAKLNESIMVIKVSELVKDNDPIMPPISPEVLAQIEQIIAELAGPSALVELEMVGNEE
jgi:hypothetical protein